MTTIVERDENLKVKYITEPMSILDHFALAAMQVLMAEPDRFIKEDRIAEVSYYQAYCMMKERKQYESSGG